MKQLFILPLLKNRLLVFITSTFLIHQLIQRRIHIISFAAIVLMYDCFSFIINQPVIVLSDSLAEGNMVALLLQKSIKQYVLIAVHHENEPQPFTKLLDILLTTDDSIPKLSNRSSKNLLTGWSWWRSWKKGSENETSSSEFYQSASLEEDKRILIQPSKTAEKVISKPEHTKEYFNQIHDCLDRMVFEMDKALENSVINASLLSIVNPLLYCHMVDCVKSNENLRLANAIEAMHRDQDNHGSVNGSGSFHSLSGPHLLVLTQSHLLFLKPSMLIGDQSSSVASEKSVSTSTEKVLDEENSLDIEDQKENEIMMKIVESLEKYGFCSVEDVEQNDNQDDIAYIVKMNLPLTDIQGVNILVRDEKETSSDSTDSPVIHVQCTSEESIYFHVDYAIFVVNEIMKRIDCSYSCLLQNMDCFCTHGYFAVVTC